mmetsp:Transcript_79436/g.219700  ORF Transcript_79436/g.219700 Transcript_79436/m.219700 type:complete len:416 (-) Transcript_79436:364-1611(-)
MVVDAVLLAHCLHQLTCFPQIVPGQTWVEMVFNLELQANVHPVQQFRGGNIHCGVHLSNVPLVLVIVVCMAVVRVHCPMRDHDLDVQDAPNGMRDQNPTKGLLPSWHRKCNHDDPGCVNGQCADLQATVVEPFLRQELDPRLRVEVESGDHHDRVEEHWLVADQKARNRIHRHMLCVICGPEGFLEDARRDSENWHVLDVWVVLHGVADNVMRVVVALPPTCGDAHQGCQGRATHVIKPKDMGHPTVAKVVANASKLLPEDPENRSAAHVCRQRSAANREPKRTEKKGCKPSAHLSIEGHVSLEQATPQQFLPDSTEVNDMRRHRVIRDLTHEVWRQHNPVDARCMVICKHVSAVLPCHVLHGQHTTWMLFHKICDVIHAAIHDDPQVSPCIVACHLCHCVLRKRLLCMLLCLWQ